MNRKTRHILLITLCAISALPMCLSAFFLGGRILIRKTMLEKLEAAETVVLQIPANDLHWYKKNHELLIDGRMFDVKSIRSTDKGYEVTGLFDDDETKLFDQLVKTEKGRQKGQGPLAGLFQSCLGMIAESPFGPVLQKPDFGIPAQLFAEAPAARLCHIALDQQGPPPKGMLS